MKLPKFVFLASKNNVNLIFLASKAGFNWH